MWQQQDAMRRRAIISLAIPRSFRDQKEAILPYCGR